MPNVHRDFAYIRRVSQLKGAVVVRAIAKFIFDKKEKQLVAFGRFRRMLYTTKISKKVCDAAE